MDWNIAYEVNSQNILMILFDKFCFIELIENWTKYTSLYKKYGFITFQSSILLIVLMTYY